LKKVVEEALHSIFYKSAIGQPYEGRCDRHRTSGGWGDKKTESMGSTQQNLTHRSLLFGPSGPAKATFSEDRKTLLMALHFQDHERGTLIERVIRFKKKWGLSIELSYNVEILRNF